MEKDGSKVWLTIAEQRVTEYQSPRDVKDTNVRPMIEARKQRHAEVVGIIALDDDEVGPIERSAAQYELGTIVNELSLLKEMDVQLNPKPDSFDELLGTPEF